MIFQRLNVLCTFLFFLTFLLSLANSYGQLPIKEYDQDQYTDSIDIYRANYGHKKKIPKEFELPILLTLSHYPELDDISIEFVVKNIKTTMATRPALREIFNSKRKRHFKIFINNNARKLPGALLKDLPFNAQVGIIAHEFEHVKEYLHNTCFDLVYTGLAYVCSKDFKARYERKTEMNTIRKGFGWQVVAFSKHLFKKSGVSSAYLKYKRAFYFSPEDLTAIMKKENMY